MFKGAFKGALDVAHGSSPQQIQARYRELKKTEKDEDRLVQMLYKEFSKKDMEQWVLQH